MDARAQLDAGSYTSSEGRGHGTPLGACLLPYFPLWGPFENARWALPWCPFENARWTPGHSWTREVRQAPKVEGISLQHVLQASEILRIVILSAIYLTDKCRTQGTPLGICNGMTKALGAEFNRQVVARAAYSISRIDRDQFRRLSG